MADLTITERKHLSALQQKKFRTEFQECLVEGLRLCEEALHSSWHVKRLFVTREFQLKPEAAELLQQADRRGIPPESLPAETIERITATRHTQGVALLLDIPTHSEPSETRISADRFLLLDGVSDPGNVGTLLRSADWFGITNIICGPGTVEWTNPKVIRASMGAVFHTQIITVDSWDTIFNSLRESGVPLLAADLGGVNIAQTHFSRRFDNWGLILGNEAHGISTALVSRADHRITIPGRGDAESLNVAMAGTILLYELCRNFNSSAS